MYPIFKYLSALFYASSLAFTAFATETSFKFDFGVGQAPAGYIAVGPDCAYDVSKGYGLEPGPRPQALCRSKAGTITNDFLCSENSPFLFSVLLPEGNYRVHVVLGDPELSPIPRSRLSRAVS